MTQPSDKLFDEVMADARTKADRARRRGVKDAEAAGQKADRQARADADKILSAARADADVKRNQILATLALEAQRDRLARLEECLQKVYHLVRHNIQTLDAPRRHDAQLRLGLEALGQMPDGTVEIALPQGDHAEYGARLVDDLAARAAQNRGSNVTVRLADRPADVPDGLVVRSADGHTEIVNSFEERLRRLWPELRLDVAARLFPELVQTKET